MFWNCDEDHPHLDHIILWSLEETSLTQEQATEIGTQRQDDKHAARKNSELLKCIDYINMCSRGCILSSPIGSAMEIKATLFQYLGKSWPEHLIRPEIWKNCYIVAWQEGCGEECGEERKSVAGYGIPVFQTGKYLWDGLTFIWTLYALEPGREQILRKRIKSKTCAVVESEDGNWNWGIKWIDYRASSPESREWHAVLGPEYRYDAMKHHYLPNPETPRYKQ